MKKFDTKRQLILYFMKGSIRFFVMSAVFAAMVSLLDMLRPRVISFTVDSVIGTEAPDLPAFVLHLIDRGGRGADHRPSGSVVPLSLPFFQRKRSRALCGTHPE